MSTTATEKKWISAPPSVTDRSIESMFRSACHRLGQLSNKKHRRVSSHIAKAIGSLVAQQASVTEKMIIQLCGTFAIALPLYHRAHEDFDRTDVLQRDFALC